MSVAGTGVPRGHRCER